MDLSAVIFVVLALAWALYLIPKALKHHDEMASDRLVEGHSHRVRILQRHGRRGAAPIADTGTTAVTESVAEVVAEAPVDFGAPTVSAPVRPAARALVTRDTARRAARRRRRVLGVLLFAVAAVAVLATTAVVPYVATAVPAALVVVWLVIARLSVRSAQRARSASPRARAARPVVRGEEVLEESSAEVLVEELTEDTVGVRREELEAALADDGSLWDPLPMTLPTYVNKARARRTVRTIELTGMTSSGHDETDSALAREAESRDAEAGQDASAEQRKAAGA